MRADEELLELATKLQEASERIERAEYKGPLEALEKAAKQVGKSFSGSWLGYHSRVYYAGFDIPPPGAHFSQEWGIEERFGGFGSKGDWREFRHDDVKLVIVSRAGNPDLSDTKFLAKEAEKFFADAKAEIESIFHSFLTRQEDTFIAKLKKELTAIDPVSVIEVVNLWHTKGRVMTRDTVVLGQGTQVPPHIEVLAEVASIRSGFHVCRKASEIAKKAGSHIGRQGAQAVKKARIGTNVFIGHGRSAAWRELKDFVRDRLKLPFDEFNRVPVAGVTNIARLSEMLDAAAVAFVIMTAEDEQKDGKLQARMNVIHEVGLFQGRLGFTKGIVMLEEGCEEFSNIHGLGQIRFPEGRISAAFEEVRQVLEREGLIAD